MLEVQDHVMHGDSRVPAVAGNDLVHFAQLVDQSGRVLEIDLPFGRQADFARAAVQQTGRPFAFPFLPGALTRQRA